MLQRRLGANGPLVSAIGLGCMGMSDLYGPSDRAAGVATIRAAIDAGVTLFDTGDFYGMGDNELLVGEAIKPYRRESILLSVKFGALRDPSGAWTGFDGRPAAVKNFLAYSLKRLGVDCIDIYRPARLDPAVPIEETIGAVADLVRAGYVRFIGLSEAGSDTLRRAAAVHPIVDLQIEYGLLSRDIETSILPTCRELGVSITAYGVLGRGLLGGHWTKNRVTSAGDYRALIPRFRAENVERNLQLVEVVRTVAEAHHVTVAQIAIAWALSRGTDIVPIIGARRPDQLADALAAIRVSIEPEDIVALDRLSGSVCGTRYPALQMAHLDSEKG
ncbi:MAG: aldo/keto reductase [Hyphomicrobiales bacterium]|nr:MAG: aldo/keto reductase [Hyphomicrobiales bacterium]